jgi:hypothetical protein
MSGSEGHDAPRERAISLDWGTVFGFLALLFAGFASWQAMNERVARLEGFADPQLHSKLARLEAGQDEILRRLDRIERHDGEKG